MYLFLSVSESITNPIVSSRKRCGHVQNAGIYNIFAFYTIYNKMNIVSTDNMLTLVVLQWLEQFEDTIEHIAVLGKKCCVLLWLVESTISFLKSFFHCK